MSWKRPFLRARRDGESREELAAYLADESEDNRARGMSAEAAMLAARRKLGNPTYIREEIYRMNSAGLLDSIARDARYGMRLLRRQRGFTAVVVLTLALGIGASTAVFSLVNTILLKPLSFPEPEKITVLERVSPPGLGFPEYPWSRSTYWLISQETATFSSIGAFKPGSFNLTGAGDPLRLDGLLATAGFFPALGVTPELGRVFTADEDQPGRAHVAVISHQLWRDRFSSDPGVLGKAIAMNGESFTIIGVMPPGFVFPRAEEMPAVFGFSPVTQVWVPMQYAPGPAIRGEEADAAIIARLRSGVSMASAQAVMDLYMHRRDTEVPATKGWNKVRVTALKAQEVANARRPLLLMLGAVLLVLLVASSNVANLLLARSLGRQTEFAMRAALGASRRRIAAQLITEGLLLAIFGGAGGLLLARLALAGVIHFGPADVARLRDTTLDVRVFVFAALAAVTTGVLFSLAPLVIARGTDNAREATRGSARVVGRRSGARLRAGLLVSQIALALALVISAGLLTRTFVHLLKVDAGFNPEHVLSFELTLPEARYPDQPRIVALYERILASVRALPGVQSAGVVEHIPMGGIPESTVVSIVGHAVVPGRLPYVDYTMVSPGYFETVHTPLLRGRDFAESDTATSQPVLIVNQSMANEFWPGEDAMGKQATPPLIRPAPVVVGIVADSKHLSLREEPTPEMYVPYTQKVWPSLLTMDVVVRAAGDPAAITGSLRAAIHSVDADLPMANVMPLESVVQNSMVTQRFTLLVLAAFAAIAMLLAAIGMYGVISYSVAQRTNEIGVRMALGARTRAVAAMVMGEAARHLVIGIAAGVAVAFVGARLISSFLYGVRAADPLTYACVIAVLAAVVLGACYVPVRRALRIDPMTALRAE